MEFKGLEKNSLIEWPGRIVAVAFTGGCNFRCPFCQNKDLVLSPERLPTISADKVIDHLKSKKRWLDGLAITGGEPTIHSSLPSFARRVKENGFKLGIETNGTNPEVLENLVEEDLVDHFFLDVKAPLSWKKYSKAIGVEDRQLLEKIKRSMEILRESEVDHEFRTTVVPEILNKDDLLEIAEQIKETTNHYYLQQFVPENTLDENYEKIEPYSDDKLREIKEKIKGNFESCEIRNISS